VVIAYLILAFQTARIASPLTGPGIVCASESVKLRRPPPVPEVGVRTDVFDATNLV
jgi:hypothetical protein